MNRVFLLVAGLCVALNSMAQNDTTLRSGASGSDTLRVGNLLIVRGLKDSAYDMTYTRVTRRKHDHRYKPANISTNWGIVDIGFTNYNDKTIYSSPGAQQFAPGGSKDWFKLNTGKSVDVNIWLFMQRINVIAHVVNLKYGLGIELNNYRFEQNIRFKTNPTTVIMDTINYTKNKLAEDFVTVPVMLNFNFTPHRSHPFGLSAGASFGYRYSAREKFKSEAQGKQKTYNDFDLNPWKISYIAELELRWLNIYGSYATHSIFSRGLDITPYSFGIRIGNW